MPASNIEAPEVGVEGSRVMELATIEPLDTVMTAVRNFTASTVEVQEKSFGLHYQSCILKTNLATLGPIESGLINGVAIFQRSVLSTLADMMS